MGFNSGLKGLNGLVRFAERRNLVSARVPSHFNWPLPPEGPQGKGGLSLKPPHVQVVKQDVRRRSTTYGPAR
jgi:hypothetical protein